MFGTKTVCGFTVCLMSAFASVSTASVYMTRLRPIQFTPRASDYSRGLDASLIEPVEPVGNITSKDVQGLIPTDLDPNNQSDVGRKILDQSFKHAMNSDMFKNSSLGRTAQSVQKSMQTNVTVASREPNSIKHEFKIAADPIQAQAHINYTGLTNANLSYQASESKLNFEVREPMHVLSTDMVYNHINLPNDRKDLMSLRWNW